MNPRDNSPKILLASKMVFSALVALLYLLIKVTKESLMKLRSELMIKLLFIK